MSEKERKRYPKPEDFEPEPFFLEGHRFVGKARCTAWARTAGRQCGQVAINGTSKCYNHGGASDANRGPKNGNWKHGRYEGKSAAINAPPHSEAVLKTKWRAAYMRYLTDVENLSLSDDIALNRARIAESIETAGNSVTPNFLDTLEVIAQEMKVAMQNNDPQAVAMNVVNITKMITQARDDMLGQAKLDRLIGQRVVLVEKQTRMIKEAENHLATSVVISLLLKVFGMICDIVEKHSDPLIARSIFSESSLIVKDAMIYLGTTDESEVIEGEASGDS